MRHVRRGSDFHAIKKKRPYWLESHERLCRSAHLSQICKRVTLRRDGVRESVHSLYFMRSSSSTRGPETEKEATDSLSRLPQQQGARSRVCRPSRGAVLRRCAWATLRRDRVPGLAYHGLPTHSRFLAGLCLAGGEPSFTSLATQESSLPFQIPDDDTQRSAVQSILYPDPSQLPDGELASPS